MYLSTEYYVHQYLYPLVFLRNRILTIDRRYTILFQDVFSVNHLTRLAFPDELNARKNISAFAYTSASSAFIAALSML